MQMKTLLSVRAKSAAHVLHPGPSYPALRGSKLGPTSLRNEQNITYHNLNCINCNLTFRLTTNQTRETCQAWRFMASCCTPHVSFTPPGEHIGLDSLADNSPPGQAKGFGQCNDRVMSGASTIKPRTSSKNSDEGRPSVTGCTMSRRAQALCMKSNQGSCGRPWWCISRPHQGNRGTVASWSCSQR